MQHIRRYISYEDAEEISAGHGPVDLDLIEEDIVSSGKQRSRVQSL